MKKTLIIALSCLAILFAACHKPDEPTPVDPTPVDYTANYVGNYLGQFTLTVTSMNNQPQSSLSFPIDSISMDIAKGTEMNAIMATMHIDNETYQATGTATAEKTDFGSIHLDLDKPDFTLNLDLRLECGPLQKDTLNFTGDFTGHGTIMFMGQEQVFDEMSGNVNGNLGKQ